MDNQSKVIDKPTWADKAGTAYNNRRKKVKKKTKERSDAWDARVTKRQDKIASKLGATGLLKKQRARKTKLADRQNKRKKAIKNKLKKVFGK